MYSMWGRFQSHQRVLLPPQVAISVKLTLDMTVIFLVRSYGKSWECAVGVSRQLFSSLDYGLPQHLRPAPSALRSLYAYLTASTFYFYLGCCYTHIATQVIGVIFNKLIKKYVIAQFLQGALMFVLEIFNVHFFNDFINNRPNCKNVLDCAESLSFTNYNTNS